MNAIYKVMGISKQANHQYNKRTEHYQKEVSDLIVQVDALRAAHPGCGLEKMYYTLRPNSMGRDQFIDIFMKLGYRVHTPKNYTKTTVPGHLRFPNLIEGMAVCKPNQLWQTDITYFLLKGKFYYLTFIIDVYTRKIIGYTASNHLRAEANIIALKQALKTSQTFPIDDLIHHSDMGSQYTSNAYLSVLSKNNVTVSMGVKGQDNAYAERVNGIIKNEYLKKWLIKDFKDLKRKLTKAVNHYNTKRLHRSLEMETPVMAEKNYLSLPDREKPMVIIYADGKPKSMEVSNLHRFNREKPQAHNCPMVNIV